MLSRFDNPMILLCILALVSQGLKADSFRCGRKLVSAGDSAGALVRVCGQPNHKDRGMETIGVNGVAKETSVERWYYKKNSRSLEHVVIIHKGRVAAVQLGHR